MFSDYINFNLHPYKRTPVYNETIRLERCSYFLCAFRCLAIGGCLGFNYAWFSCTCELVVTSCNPTTVPLVDDSEWNYYSAKLTPWFIVKHRNQIYAMYWYAGNFSQLLAIQIHITNCIFFYWKVLHYNFFQWQESLLIAGIDMHLVFTLPALTY